MFKIFNLSLILVIVTCNSARAQNLYSGEVLVPDQSVAERQQSVPAALIQVLQKHSGQRELPLHHALDVALLDAQRIMVSFHYQNRERTAPDGTQSKELWLVAHFLPQAVDQIVRDLELPRWRPQRRTITIWIVVDDGLGRRLMPVEYAYAWNAMTDVAKFRGLPVSWPELDKETLEQVDLQLLWGGYMDGLVALISNGEAAIVAARREGPTWNVRWNFTSGGETSSWRIRDRDLSFALVDGLHQLTDRVAARDAIAPSAQGNWQFELAVNGFLDADDYARCLAYLQGLSVIDEVNILEVKPGEIRFALDLNALPQYLENEIEKDGILVASQADNRYRLVP